MHVENRTQDGNMVWVRNEFNERKLVYFEDCTYGRRTSVWVSIACPAAGGFPSRAPTSSSFLKALNTPVEPTPRSLLKPSS